MQALGPEHEAPRLDFSRASRRLRLAERARENARLELPPQHDGELDGPQREVVDHVRGEVERICAAYAASLVELNRRIRELDVARRTRALKHAPTELSRQLRELSTRVELGLRRASGEHAAARAEYDAFRTRHRITREPRYPATKLAPVALLLSVMVAKAGLVVCLLAPGSSALAVPLVFVDALLAFQLGRIAPWMGAPDWRHRLAGLGGSVGFVVWAGGFNQLARLLPGADGTLLIGVGMALSAAAALIGFCSDDRMPGYGALHRKLARARSEHDYWSSACLKGAAALHERQQGRIDTVVRGVEEDLDELARAIEAKSRLLDEIRDFARNFENAANALLRLYRDTNLGHRSTPAPEYFERTWRLHLPDHLVDAVDDDLQRLHTAQRTRECAERLAELARHRARETWQEFLTQCADVQSA
jgi:hypothetical protein